MKVSLPKLSRTEWGIFCLLVASLLTLYLSLEWGLHEAMKVSSIELATDQSAQIVARLKLAATIQSAASTVFIIIYLILLATARRFNNTSIILKWLLIIPAGYYIILFLRVSSDGYSMRYLLLLLAIAVVLPNRWLSRTRIKVSAYSVITHMLAAVFIAITFYSVKSMSQEAFVSSLLMVSAMYLILISACTVSAWSAYLSCTEDHRAMRGLTIYRWLCIVLIAAVCSSYAAISKHVSNEERARQEQFDKKLQQLESLSEDIQSMDEELLIGE